MLKALMVTAILLSATAFAGDSGQKVFKPIAPANAQKALPGQIAKPKDKAQAKIPLRGAVVWIDASRQALWINLGQADGLKPRAKFQVMQNQDDEAVKGQVEVIRLLAPNLSEARIVTQEEKDPVAKGDVIAP